MNASAIMRRRWIRQRHRSASTTFAYRARSVRNRRPSRPSGRCGRSGARRRRRPGRNRCHPPTPEPPASDQSHHQCPPRHGTATADRTVGVRRARRGTGPFGPKPQSPAIGWTVFFRSPQLLVARLHNGPPSCPMVSSQSQRSTPHQRRRNARRPSGPSRTSTISSRAGWPAPKSSRAPEFGEHTLQVDYDEIGVPVTMEYRPGERRRRGSIHAGDLRAAPDPMRPPHRRSTESRRHRPAGRLRPRAPRRRRRQSRKWPALGGTLQLVDECLVAEFGPDGSAGQRTLIVWEFGTTWDPTTTSVIQQGERANRVSAQQLDLGGGYPPPRQHESLRERPERSGPHPELLRGSRHHRPLHRPVAGGRAPRRDYLAVANGPQCGANSCGATALRGGCYRVPDQSQRLATSSTTMAPGASSIPRNRQTSSPIAMYTKRVDGSSASRPSAGHAPAKVNSRPWASSWVNA